MNWDIFLLSDNDEIIRRLKEYGIIIEDDKEFKIYLELFRDRIKEYPDKPELTYTRDEIIDEAISLFPINNNVISYDPRGSFKIGFLVKDENEIVVNKEYRKQKRIDYDDESNEILMTPYYYENL